MAEYAEGYYCDRCGDLAHEPGACRGENVALGRCACPTLGYERGVPAWMSRPPRMPPGDDPRSGKLLPPPVLTHPVIAAYRKFRDRVVSWGHA